MPEAVAKATTKEVVDAVEEVETRTLMTKTVNTEERRKRRCSKNYSVTTFASNVADPVTGVKIVSTRILLVHNVVTPVTQKRFVGETRRKKMKKTKKSMNKKKRIPPEEFTNLTIK